MWIYVCVGVGWDSVGTGLCIGVVILWDSLETKSDFKKLSITLCLTG